MLMNIMYGLLGGLSYGLTGYLKNQHKEYLEWSKLIPTLIISSVVGGIAGYLNQDIGILMTGTIGITVTILIQNLWKTLNNKMKWF